MNIEQIVPAYQALRKQERKVTELKEWVFSLGDTRIEKMKQSLSDESNGLYFEETFKLDQEFPSFQKGIEYLVNLQEQVFRELNVHPTFSHSAHFDFQLGDRKEIHISYRVKDTEKSVFRAMKRENDTGKNWLDVLLSLNLNGHYYGLSKIFEDGLYNPDIFIPNYIHYIQKEDFQIKSFKISKQHYLYVLTGLLIRDVKKEIKEIETFFNDFDIAKELIQQHLA